MGIVWKATATAPLNGIPVEVVGAAKASIAARCGGVVPPAEFLEEITPAQHPCHALVEWDDTVAGYQYRLHQVSGVLQCVVAVYEPDEPPTRDIGGIVATVQAPDGSDVRYRGYMPVFEVLSSDDYTQQATRRLVGRVVGDLRNHRDLPLAQELLDAVLPVVVAWDEANPK